MNIVGMNELKEQLEIITNDATAYRIGAARVPHFACSIAPGNGQTTVAEYITYFLFKNRLRSFCGLDNLLEYRLDGSLKQLKKVFENIHANTVYSNEFQGVISIDITCLSEYSNEYQVDFFLEEIVKIGANATIIIFYDDSLGKKMEQVKNRVVEVLNCKDIISHYTTSDLASILANIIIEKGIDLEIGKEMDYLLRSIVEDVNVTSVKDALKLAETFVFYADYSSFIPRLDAKMIRKHFANIK